MLENKYLEPSDMALNAQDDGQNTSVASSEILEMMYFIANVSRG